MDQKSELLVGGDIKDKQIIFKDGLILKTQKFWKWEKQRYYMYDWTQLIHKNAYARL